MSEITNLEELVPNTIAKASDLNLNFDALKVANNEQNSQIIDLIQEDVDINALIDIDQANIHDLDLRVTITESICSTNSIDIGDLQSDKLNLSGGIMTGILEVVDGVDATDAVNLGQVEELISEIDIPAFMQQLPIGYISGMVMYNQGDYEILVSAGCCRDLSNAEDIVFSNPIIKTLTSFTNETWYHLFAIAKINGTSPNLLFSTSLSNPTLPTGYLYKRRIGSVYSGQTQIYKFKYDGTDLKWLTPINLFNDIIIPENGYGSDNGFGVATLTPDLSKFVKNTISVEAIDYHGTVLSTGDVGGGDSFVPIMTSNILPSGLAFSNSVHEDYYDWGIYKAFDGNLDTLFISNFDTPVHPTVLGYISASTHGYKVVNITYKAEMTPWMPPYIYGAPTNFKVQGSNNTTTGLDGTWDDLATFSPTWELSEDTQSFQVSSDTAYIAHRISVSSWADGPMLKCMNLEFIQSPEIPSIIPRIVNFWTI